MPQGIQIWDAAGTMIMDTTTWCGQVLGNFTLAGGRAAGSTVDARLSQGRPWVMVLPFNGNEGSAPGGNPITDVVTFSGTTISWNASPNAVQVIYGIY